MVADGEHGSHTQMSHWTFRAAIQIHEVLIGRLLLIFGLVAENLRKFIARDLKSYTAFKSFDRLAINDWFHGRIVVASLPDEFETLLEDKDDLEVEEECQSERNVKTETGGINDIAGGLEKYAQVHAGKVVVRDVVF